MPRLLRFPITLTSSLLLILISITFAVGVSSSSSQTGTSPPIVNSSKSPQRDSSNHDDNELQWQSAYWSLVALGLNAMTQASGADRQLASTSFSPARSSPIVCIADIIVLLAWTIAGLWRGVPFLRSLGTAAYHVKHDSEIETETIPDDVFGNGIPTVSLIFFFLAPFPQFVKLCGMENVPLTQTIGAVYMAVYVISLFASICPGPGNDDGHGGEHESSERQLQGLEIKRLQEITHNFYTTVIGLQFITWIILTLILSIVTINAGLSYLTGLLAIPGLLLYITFRALSGSSEREKKSQFLFMWFLVFGTILLWAAQANSNKVGGGTADLGPPEDRFLHAMFVTFKWLGSTLILGIMIAAAVFVCATLMAVLNSFIRSLPARLEKISSNQARILVSVNTNSEDVEMNSRQPSQPEDEALGNKITDTDHQTVPASTTTDWASTEDHHEGETATSSLGTTPGTETSLSMKAFARWLKQDERSIGHIGESPANPRPYGHHPQTLLGIARSKARGDPYWVEKLGGQATSPPAATIYLSAAQVAIAKADLKLKWAEKERDRSVKMSVAFAITNMIFGLLFFIYKYDARGTVKPGWTDLLG